MNMLKNLRHDEEILLVVRQYPLVWFHHFFWAFFTIFIPFVFMVPLFRWGGIGAALFFSVAVFGILLLVRSCIMWYRSSIILTNQRLVQIQQRGFFDRIVSEVSLDSIQHSSYERKGISQTLLRYGSLTVQTFSGSEFSFEGASRPQLLHDALIEARRYAQSAID